jgi:hypothetical protein
VARISNSTEWLQWLFRYSTNIPAVKEKRKKQDRYVSGLESTFTSVCVKINKRNWWLIEKRMIRKNGPLDKREWARRIDRKVQTKEPLYSLDFWSVHTREELREFVYNNTRWHGSSAMKELIPLVLVFSCTVQLLSLPYWGDIYICIKRGCTSRASISTLSRVNFGNCRYSITVGWGGRATGTRPTHPTQLF